MKINILIISAFFILHSAFAGDGLFVSSDTFVVTNSATAALAVTNHPQIAGANCAWHPAGILANFRDSPTGEVLRVDHVRAGIINRHVNTTNTISVTNTLFTTNAIGAISAIIWDPAGVYTIVPPNDSLRITTSSTNAEIILNKNVE